MNDLYSDEDDFDMKFNTFKSKYFACKKTINDLLTTYLNEQRLNIMNHYLYKLLIDHLFDFYNHNIYF